MLVIDIIFIVILIGFFVYGWQTGLIKAIGGLVGIILGIVFAGRYYEVIADWVLPYVKDNENMATVIGYLCIFVAVNIIISVTVAIITGIFKLIPFMTIINRLAGAIVMVIGGILAIGYILFIISSLPFSEFITRYSEGSILVPIVQSLFGFLAPMLPEVTTDATKLIKEQI